MERTHLASRTSLGEKSIIMTKRSAKSLVITMGIWTSMACATGTSVKRNNSTSQSQVRSPTRCLHRLASAQMDASSFRSPFKRHRKKRNVLKICNDMIVNFVSRPQKDEQKVDQSGSQKRKTKMLNEQRRSLSTLPTSKKIK